MINSQKIRTHGNIYNLLMGIGHTTTLPSAFPPKSKCEERVSAATKHISITAEVPDSAIRKEKSKAILKT